MFDNYKILHYLIALIVILFIIFGFITYAIAQGKSGDIVDFAKIPDQANLGKSTTITLPAAASNEHYKFKLNNLGGSSKIEIHCVKGAADKLIGTIQGAGSIDLPKSGVNDGNPFTNDCQKVYVKTLNCRKCKGKVTWEIK